MSNPSFWKKKKRKYFIVSSAEIWLSMLLIKHHSVLLNVPRQFLCYSSSLFVCLYVTFVLSLFLFLIKKTCLYNFDPLKHHFWIVVKLEFKGYTLFFLFLLKNIDLGFSLEPPRRGGSNEYPQSYVLSRNMKNIRNFIWKFSFFGGKIFSIFEKASFHNVLVRLEGCAL